MNDSPIFLRRVALNNYMSIARCSVGLRPLNFLVGQNGAGKSNFLDALKFTADSLNSSVEHALRERGGIGAVRRRSTGHPTHFGVRLDWSLPSGEEGMYAFRIGAKPQGAFEVQQEKCAINNPSSNPLRPSVSYEIRSGEFINGTIEKPPATVSDRLFLVAMSGQPEFRPLYDALRGMGFYNFNPDVIRELQSPNPGEVLASDGCNLASVVKRLEESPDIVAGIVEKLGRVVPGITGVRYRAFGKKETLEFLQKVSGSQNDWRFDAENMSDGTLRSLGVLVALFQSSSSSAQKVRIVGIEEPETALHPGAAAVLRSALLEASAQTQVIVTSHSPDLLDDKDIEPEALIAVTSEHGETKIGPIDTTSRDAIRDHLFTAGELLRLNQIGTDEAALQAAGDVQQDFFADA